MAASNTASLDEALETARQAHIDRNPRSLALFERAQAYMPGGNTRTVLHYDPFPIYVASSGGARLRDVDDHTYLDVLGEYSAGLYGHGDAEIATEIARIARLGRSNGAPGQNEIELAELMCARFPAVEQVRFCNSGTEANLYALTLARNVTGRKGVLVFAGAYHGGVLAFPSDAADMNVPFEWTIARFNDMMVLGRIRELGASLAAVIVEPMLSNGGSIAADPAFLTGLREATAETGALLIFDEVVTSRMGPGGIHGELGITPDLVTFGKYIGAGFSFGAFGGRRELMDYFNPRATHALVHAGTFNNNVFSMAVGAYGLREIFTPERSRQFFAAGTKLRERLTAAAAEACPGVQFTGCGSVMSIHFAREPLRSPEDLAGESRALLDLFHFDLLEAGVYAARRGQMCLSLAMTDADFDKIVEATADTLERRRAIIEATMA